MSQLTVLLLVVAALTIAAVLVGMRRLRRGRAAVEARERGFRLPDGAGVEPGEEVPKEEVEAPAPTGETPRTAAPRISSPVQLTVFHPQELLPGEWVKLLAYVHLAAARDQVAADRQKVLAGEAPAHRRRTAGAILPIAREAVIRIVPELPGCRFNPPEASVLWLEDWHCALFRMQAHDRAPGFVRGQAVNGRVAFYVETVLVGEVPIWALISERDELSAVPLEPTAPADLYEKVFASYSHRDGEVVESLGRAYRALGMQFLRDVETLRSGEQWSRRLLELIEEADIFQLYWSEEARRSQYVAQEWRHALAQGRDGFIRPLFWRRPMPPPPAELAAIHFAYLPGGEEG